MALSKYLVVMAIILACMCTGVAHTLLTWPRPVKAKHCRLGGENNEECSGPCQIGAVRNTGMAPVQRGETLRVRYQTNNHAGGFARFSLVPAKQRKSFDAHERYAIHFTCFNDEQRSYNCKSNNSDTTPLPSNTRTGHGRGQPELGECGTSGDNLAAFADVPIPDVYPDGEYYLAYSWYGGLEWDQSTSFFGTYWSCAIISIVGGRPLSTGPFRASFSGDGKLDGLCRIAEGYNYPKECNNGRERCDNRAAVLDAPREFQQGQVPQEITAEKLLSSQRAVADHEEVNTSSSPSTEKSHGIITAPVEESVASVTVPFDGKLLVDWGSGLEPSIVMMTDVIAKLGLQPPTASPSPSVLPQDGSEETTVGVQTSPAAAADVNITKGSSTVTSEEGNALVVVDEVRVIDVRTMASRPLNIASGKSTIRAADYPNGFTLGVTATPDDMLLVKFDILDSNGEVEWTHLEGSAPFLIAGNIGIDYARWQVQVGNIYLLHITAKSGDGATDKLRLNIHVEK